MGPICACLKSEGKRKEHISLKGVAQTLGQGWPIVKVNESSGGRIKGRTICTVVRVVRVLHFL